LRFRYTFRKESDTERMARLVGRTAGRGVQLGEELELATNRIDNRVYARIDAGKPYLVRNK
jgi:hypothetical protein